MAGSDLVLTRLLALHPKLIDLSLDRMHRVLNALGNPERRLPKIIHIAGTNGKGSTQAFLKAMLEADGKIVHTYTSPHLVQFHERITLAGQHIREPHLAALLAECEEANGGAPITFFEITTAAAFLAFSRTEADWLILEVGLGGRLDATNVVESDLSIITPVGIDHQEFLGPDIATIAFEKAGIIQDNTPLIVAPQTQDARDVIEAQANLKKAPLAIGGQDWQSYEAQGRLIYEDETGLLDLDPPALQGPHQFTNAGTAISAARKIGLSNDAIIKGLANAQWLGRLQRLHAGPIYQQLQSAGWAGELWLDGGHNEAAAQMLSNWADRRYHHQGAKLTILCGMLNTKAAHLFFKAFSNTIIDITFHMVPIPDQQNTYDPVVLAELARAHGLESEAHHNMNDALAAIASSNGNTPILICGSLYLAGWVLRDYPQSSS